MSVIALLRKPLLALIATFYISPAFSGELALGDEASPVTIIEYGSLTCGYCIGFHRSIFPEIKRDYIDTGKARFIYRHYPTGNEAKLGAVALECADEQYYALLDGLFATVDDWASTDNIYAALEKQASQVGLDKRAFKQCFESGHAMQRVLDEQQHARQTYGTKGTPTFLINGEVYQGKRSAQAFKKIIDAALSPSTNAPAPQSTSPAPHDAL